MATGSSAVDSAAGILSQLPPARDIPASFGASFKHWWALGDKGGAVAEERLLRRLPSYRSTPPTDLSSEDGPVVSYRERIPVLDAKNYLNMFAIRPTAPKPDAPAPAVVLHGYGAGLGFFFLNFPTLAKWAGTRGAPVYSLDWLGMGRSSRPPFNIKAKRTDTPARVEEAENFFLNSLEEWREKMGLEKMTLVGHSLGGYLSVAYALRHPERVSKLILLSPAGVPRDPNNTEEPSRELTDVQSRGSGSADIASSRTVDALHKEQAAEKKKESRSRKLFTYLWEEGYSPFQVVRSSVFWGPMLVGKYSSRRFAALDDEATRDMHDYIVNLTVQKGSGEYCISHLLAPGAHARMPLVDRIAALKIPVVFVYGEHDWMDPKGGSDSVENLRKAGNPDAKMYIVNDAGHHVYLDNAKAVNKLLMQELN